MLGSGLGLESELEVEVEVELELELELELEAEAEPESLVGSNETVLDRQGGRAGAEPATSTPYYQPSVKRQCHQQMADLCAPRSQKEMD